MEPECSSPHSQRPAPPRHLPLYSARSIQSMPSPCHLLKNHFHIIFPSTPRSSKYACLLGLCYTQDIQCLRPTEFAGHGLESPRYSATYRSTRNSTATGSFLHRAHSCRSAQMYTNDFQRCAHVSGNVRSITIRAWRTLLQVEQCVIRVLFVHR